MKYLILIACMLLSAATNMYGQLTTEYFFDTDPGHGKATQNATRVGDNTMTLRSSQLNAGVHLLGIRSKDASGQWSPTLTTPVYVFAPMTSVSSAEWFMDADPGHGKGTHVTMAAGSNVMTIPTKGVATGVHLLGIRSVNTSGQWSPTLTSPIYIVEPLDVARAEWFVDTDPGEGRANSIDVNGSRETAFIVPTDRLEVGNHSLTVRIMTASGNWLPFTVTPFTVTNSTGIAAVESVMNVAVSRMADRIVLTCSENMTGARVEMFTVNGSKYASCGWTDGAQNVSLDVPQDISPVIVTVTKPGGVRFVKLIR